MEATKKADVHVRTLSEKTFLWAGSADVSIVCNSGRFLSKDSTLSGFRASAQGSYKNLEP